MASGSAPNSHPGVPAIHRLLRMLLRAATFLAVLIPLTAGCFIPGDRGACAWLAARSAATCIKTSTRPTVTHLTRLTSIGHSRTIEAFSTYSPSVLRQSQKRMCNPRVRSFAELVDFYTGIHRRFLKEKIALLPYWYFFLHRTLPL